MDMQSKVGFKHRREEHGNRSVVTHSLLQCAQQLELNHPEAPARKKARTEPKAEGSPENWTRTLLRTPRTTSGGTPPSAGMIEEHKVPLRSGYIAVHRDVLSNVLREGYHTQGRRNVPLSEDPTTAEQIAVRLNPGMKPVVLKVVVNTDTEIMKQGARVWYVGRHLPADRIQWLKITDGFDDSETHATLRAEIQREAELAKQETAVRIKMQARLEARNLELRTAKQRLDTLQRELKQAICSKDKAEADVQTLQTRNEQAVTNLAALEVTNLELSKTLTEQQGELTTLLTEKKRLDEQHGMYTDVQDKWHDEQLKNVWNNLKQDLPQRCCQKVLSMPPPSISPVWVSRCIDELRSYWAQIRVSPLADGDRNDIRDRVEKLIRRQHQQHTFAFIDARQLVVGQQKRDAFWGVYRTLHRQHQVMKFHGTSWDRVASIANDGFKLPLHDNGVYGKGIYFASDSSKSNLYCPPQLIAGSHIRFMLECKVAVGKSLTVTKRDRSLSWKRLREVSCDSVYAPRDTKGTNGVYNDEYVVYKPEQALPMRIVAYAVLDPSVNVYQCIQAEVERIGSCPDLA